MKNVAIAEEKKRKQKERKSGKQYFSEKQKGEQFWWVDSRSRKDS